MAFDLCIETTKLYSPRQFEAFAFPYLKEIHEHLTGLGTAIFLSHICGEQNKNLPLWSRLPYGKRGMISVGKEVALSTRERDVPRVRHHGQRRPGDRAGGHPGRGACALSELHRGGKGPPGRLRAHDRVRGAAAGSRR